MVDRSVLRDETASVYFAPFTESGIVIDGKPFDNAWKEVDWSGPFGDIEGGSLKYPEFDTRFKAVWDHHYLYLAAFLVDPHVWATLTEKNSYIWRHDNDFEVFIDPDGDHHNYYELEMNALNTIWELSLEKPYRNEGKVNDPDNMEELQSAVFIEGSLNDPSDIDSGWYVEIALPWSGLQKYAKKPLPPDPGTDFRVNFSRVHWETTITGNQYKKIPDQPEYNMCWSPQGEINMHMPEKWGHLIFVVDSTEVNLTEIYSKNEIREYLMQIYHIQKTIQDETGKYSSSFLSLMDSDPPPGFRFSEMSIDSTEFEICIKGQMESVKPVSYCVNHDSKFYTAEVK